jgi:hypothetical protein
MLVGVLRPAPPVLMSFHTSDLDALDVGLTSWEQVDDIVLGWDRAWELLTGNIANEHCAGRTPLAGGCYRSSEVIIYRWRCPFWNSHGCRWQSRFVIAHWGTIYGPEQDVSKRGVHHRLHAIAVEIQPIDKHVNHLTVPAQGPPPAWHTTFVRTHPAAVRWRRNQIVHWLQEQKLADPEHCLCVRIQGTFCVVLCRRAFWSARWAPWCAN